MARDQDAERIRAHRTPNRTSRGTVEADGRRDLAVGGRRAVRDLPQLVPHAALEARAVRREFDIEFLKVATEVGMELLGGVLELLRRVLPFVIDLGDGPVPILAPDPQRQ